MDTGNLVLLAAFGGLFACALGAILAIITTYRLNRAEKEYVRILAHKHEEICISREAAMSDGKFDEAEAAEIIKNLIIYAQELEASEKNFIVRSLRQESFKGRKAYAMKLYEKIGMPIML